MVTKIKDHIKAERDILIPLPAGRADEQKARGSSIVVR